MGASGASTQLIFFVSAVIVASAVVAAAANSVYGITSGIDQKSDNIQKEMLTEISIINDPTNVPNDPVRIYVKNLGNTVLNQNYITVMLDGMVVTDYTLSLSGNTSSYWDPSSVILITIDQTLASGDHTVTVTTENGIMDRLSFRI
ncbi:MAG: hypothetical protein KKE24_08575 [Candidatus Thermoplasmatota archaeon]|nr:hypothetical protein [Candidatus Thermoplasmatota archaeon]